MDRVEAEGRRLVAEPEDIRYDIQKMKKVCPFKEITVELELLSKQNRLSKVFHLKFKIINTGMKQMKKCILEYNKKIS